jgi:hypothetical protein
VLPDQERIRTLNALKSRRNDLLNELQQMPLVIELYSLKKRKQAMEEELRETEASIDLFSRSKVYVPTKDYEESIV